MTRRMIIAIAMSVMLVALAASPSFAESDYPNHEIRFVCGFPPGSGADVLVRFFANKIAKLTGKTIIVDNRPGAGGMVALTFTAKSKPDGYTIFVTGGNAVAINANLLKNPPIDARKEIMTAATINKMPFMLVVDASSPYKTLADLTEALRKKGDKASYAYASPFAKVIAETYKVAEKLKTVEVAYKSSEDSLNDMASGTVDFGVIDPLMGLALEKQGKVRALAISTPQRTHATGTLPTFAEQGVAVDLAGWWGALVPTGTPKEIIDKINGWFTDVLKDDETKAFLLNMGADPYSASPTEANALFLREIDAWGGLLDLAHIERQ